MTSPAYRVALHVDPAFVASVRPRALAALGRRVLRVERVEAPSEVSVVVTDDDTVRELNQRFRGVDAATDVLSFGLDTDGFVTPAGSRRQLGEVIISYPTAARQAAEAGHNVEAELAHLLVHGLLHLIGYDHESSADRRAMREREDALLGRPAH